jgi:acyl carrier protein
MASKEHILSVVKKHLIDILEDIEEEEIDPAKSMKDMGANSLDIVEVVSCSMRELKVKVPRSELAQLQNIDELVDMLHDVMTKKEAEA